MLERSWCLSPICLLWFAISLGVCVCVCVCVCEFPQEAVVFSQFAVRVYMSVNSLWRHFSCVWYMCVHVLMCVCVCGICV